jgi:hypothetical protein
MSQTNLCNNSSGIASIGAYQIAIGSFLGSFSTPSKSAPGPPGVTVLCLYHSTLLS